MEKKHGNWVAVPCFLPSHKNEVCCKDCKWIWWILYSRVRVRIFLLSFVEGHLWSTWWWWLTLFLPPANEVCEGYVFTGVCHSVHRGGHVRGCSWGGWRACVVAWGCAWLLPGGRAWLLWEGRAWLLWRGCVVAPGGGGHVWLLGGMRGCSGGACMVALGGMRGCSGGACVVAPGGARAWFFRWDTVNERAVRILLECILVIYLFTYPNYFGYCQQVDGGGLPVKHCQSAWLWWLTQFCFYLFTPANFWREHRPPQTSRLEVATFKTQKSNSNSNSTN